MIVLQIANIEAGAAAVQAPRVLLFFLASVLVSIAEAIRGIKKLHGALRIIIHYFIFLFAFYACMLLPIEGMRESNMIAGMALFTLLYAIIVTICAIFSARLKANREKPTEYKSQFSKKK